MARRLRLFAAAAALIACLPAHADPITIVASLSSYIGGTAAAAVASALAWVASNVVTTAFVATSIYGGIQARRKAKAAAKRARSQFLSSLQDRFVTVLRNDPPWRIVYGRAITGGDIVAILTSDGIGITDNGATYVLPDGLKHIVVALAAHEITSINEVYIAGVPVGNLDANGWAIGGEFGGLSKSVTVTKTIAGNSSITLPGNVTAVVSSGYYDFEVWVNVTPTVSGAQITNSHSSSITVVATYTTTQSNVRIEKFLGTDTQTASAYLQAQCPTEWTATDRLRGIAYVIVTLNLQEPRFQSGPPQMSFDISGRKVYDPRSATTAYTENPALICRDYILSEWGFAGSSATIDDASVIAAANACDEPISLTVGGSTATNQPRYTCNGVITTDDDPASVLDEMANAMAGFATHSGGKWVINAGTYTAPVIALTDDDLAGAIEIVQASASYADIVNSVRGQMIERGRLAASDFDPYQNGAYVSADGKALWEDINLPFTDNRARARNLARIRVEQARDSMVIRYPAKLRAWPIQIGDRVTVTSAEYGWANKVFRVTDWSFSVGAAVELVMQEDAPEIYDLADAATTDQSPNTGLPDPFWVPAVSGVTASSGTATALMQADGSVLDRVLVTWDQVASAYVTQRGAIVVRWSRVDEVVAWQTIETSGDATRAYITGVRGGDRLTISVQAKNSFGARGPATVIGHTVVGKTSAPSTPTGLMGTVDQGVITWVWDKPADVDWAETEAREGGTNWATATALWIGRGTSVLQQVSAVGTYTLRIKHRNSSGIDSTSATSASVVVTADDLITASSSPILTLRSSGFAFVFADAAATTSNSPTITFDAVLAGGLSGTATFVATAYNAAGVSLGTINLGGSGNTRTLTAAQFNNLGAWATSYVTVTADLGGLSDTITIYRGDNGSNAVQAMLANEAHTLPTAADGTVTYTGSGTAIRVFEGVTELAYDGVGMFPGSWTATRATTSGTITPGAISASGLHAVMAQHSGMTTDAAQITVTITGKTSTGAAFSLTKIQSLAKSKQGIQGATGAPGANAQALRLTASGIGFVAASPEATTVNGPMIAFTATPINLTGTATFSATAYNDAGVSLGSITLGSTGNTRTLTAAQFTNSGAWATSYVTVTATLSDASDRVTVYRANNGSSVVQCALTNEAHTLPTTAAGVVNYTGSGTAIRVFEGATELTYDGVGTSPGKWTATRATTSGTITPGAISASGMYAVMAQHSGMTTDAAQITVTVTGKTTGGASFSLTKVQSLAKSKEGQTGQNGTRGSASIYIAGESDFQRYPNRITPKAKWAVLGTLVGNNDAKGATMDSRATTLHKSKTGATSLVVGDQLTITNSSNTQSATGWWDGTQWVDPGMVIDGNLLVEGTVSALGVNAVYTLAVQGDAITVPRASAADIPDVTITATSEISAQQVISQTFVVPTQTPGKDALPVSRLITGAVVTSVSGSGTGTAFMVIERVLSGLRSTIFSVPFSYDSAKNSVITIPVVDAAALADNTTYTYAIRVYKQSGGSSLIIGGASISILGTKGR